MKIEITTSEKGFETANYLLSIAIDQAMSLSPEKKKQLDLTTSAVEEAEKLRQSLVDGFFKQSKSKQS